MRIRVTHVEQQNPASGMRILIGLDNDDVERRFAADWGEAAFIEALLADVASTGFPEVEIEPWQILGEYRLRPLETVE